MNHQAMDWFERLTGFRESTGKGGYEQTRQRFELEGSSLRSRVNQRSFGIGQLSLVAMGSLREQARQGPPVPGRSRLRIVHGDVRQLHQRPEYAGALFQVASQFNLLEMVGETVTPEHGVTGYQYDHTQGPACAIAAGAATIYRNYFAPVGQQIGQTAELQLDGFADLGGALALALGQPAASLWTMRNGYAMFTRQGVDSMSNYIASLDPPALDLLRQRLKIGLHRDVEVTDGDSHNLPGPTVSQAYCSALPVAYNRGDTSGADWAPLAGLVLDAAYEATVWAAVINAQRGASNIVLLTMLGGGVFGNDPAWIRAAIARACRQVAASGLDIVLVSRDPPGAEMKRWVETLPN